MTLITTPVAGTPVAGVRTPEHPSAALDDAYIGHINGAMGTILHGDVAPRLGWRARGKTLLAILGPGLIVMVGDNDAGAFATYTQAGQNYGTTLMVMIGAVAMMGFCAAVFAGTSEFGSYTDALGTALGLEKYAGKLPAILFALALLDASIIGAAAVSLATAYAIGDVFSLRHSLHRKPADAKGFYAVYFGLVVIVAVVVMTPGTPLGLLTIAVQTLAGVLLPSATVFLLLLANDEAVLGPWVNTHALNLVTGVIVAVLVMLSIILTASVLFPDMGEDVIIGVLAGGSALAVLTAIAVLTLRRGESGPKRTDDPALRWTWRMPPLEELAPARLTVLNRIWMIVLRSYLVSAAGLVLLRIFRLATAGAQSRFAHQLTGIKGSPAMHRLELLRSVVASNRRRVALSLFRLASMVLHTATSLYERHMIPRDGVKVALSISSGLERWAAALHPCLGRSRHRNSRKKAGR